MEITLEQILTAREERTNRQSSLNTKYHCPILSFTMNIPGPVKDTPLIRRAFQAGMLELDRRLPRHTILERRIICSATGCEATLAMDMDPIRLKQLTVSIEDIHPLGRLFDMDVLDADLNKLDRQLLGKQDRGCIICGKPGRECASRRIHPVPELQKAVHRLLTDYFSTHTDFHTIGTWAALSLLDEVSVTPKPGLVDRNNCGSHDDMGLGTFVSSTAALVPYFRECIQLGWDTRHDKPEAAFPQLRQAGQRAEQAMFHATGGVNTHKGAIFTLGILCCAIGREWAAWRSLGPEPLFRTGAKIIRSAMTEDFRTMDDSTAGGRLYRQYGIEGIRGEVSRGCPAVSAIGIPEFQKCLRDGLDWNQAGAVTLIHLIARVVDTNMIARGGMDLASQARKRAQAILPRPTMAQITELDRWFTERNLSPGGCADLLAVVCFVCRLFTH